MALAIFKASSKNWITFQVWVSMPSG